ncbi:DMT family transporter [uncultured Roseibium sp.]|uniref:DMT family transporter n=1 Tax=uncultured Roseibium sp. TaxID=1936171 RepID=UPI003217C738
MTITTPETPTLPLARPIARLSPLSIGGMLLLAVFWGLSIPITKLGLESMPPISFTALRFTFAVPFLFLFAIGRHRIPLAALPHVVALGVVGIGIGNLSQSFGVAGASASVSTIVSATIPVFIVILAALRLGQSVSRVQQFGLATAFAGVALVALGQGNGTGELAQTTLAGVALVLMSAVAIAFYYVWSVELSARHGTVTVVIWSTLAGFFALLPFTAWEVATTSFRVTHVAFASALYLGLFVSAVCLFLWLWLLRTVPARVAASVQFLQPVFGIGASAAMFGDRMGSLFAAGVVLVLLGVGLSISTRRGHR